MWSGRLKVLPVSADKIAMSKFVTKFQTKNELAEPKKQNNLPSSARAGELQAREVNLPAVNREELPVIAAYKDLNQPAKDFAKLQQKQLVIGFFIFLILGLGIMMGQKFSQSRGVASADLQKLIPADADTVNNEHYHYDKSCYKGSNGERICMTRTSQR